MGSVQAIQVQVLRVKLLGQSLYRTHQQQYARYKFFQRTNLAKNRNGNVFSISPVDLEGFDVTVRHG